MKRFDEVRPVAHLRRLTLETERCCVRWIEQSIRFHKTPAGFRRPHTMGAEEVERFLTFRAVQRRVRRGQPFRSPGINRQNIP